MISWRPQIGDPSVIGWVTFVCYFIAAALAYIAAVKYKKNDKKGFCFWGILSFLLIILGINKQLDTQTLLIQIGRIVSENQGWYSERRLVQFIFTCLITLAGFFVFVSIWWMLKNDLRSYLLPLTGILILFTFIIVRTAGCDHIDFFHKVNPFKISMNWVLELGGIGIICLAAVRSLVIKRY